jgi:hypothetical protein
VGAHDADRHVEQRRERDQRRRGEARGAPPAPRAGGAGSVALGVEAGHPHLVAGDMEIAGDGSR